MAQVVKKLTVCDVGLEDCDNTRLHKGRVTLDGKTGTFTLCDQHVQPLLPFVGTVRAKSRGKIYAMTEVSKQRKKA